MTDPIPVRPPEPPELKVDYRDVMPVTDLPAPDVAPDPTLVELIAVDIQMDARRSTDITHLLK